jgi:hypothetical protein
MRESIFLNKNEIVTFYWVDVEIGRGAGLSLQPVAWVDDVSCPFAESAESLVRTVFSRDGERVFAAMRTQLAVGRVRPLFLRLLLSMIVQRKHPRVDALDASQTQSDELTYLGDGTPLIVALGGGALRQFQVASK